MDFPPKFTKPSIMVYMNSEKDNLQCKMNNHQPALIKVIIIFSFKVDQALK